MQDPFVVGQAIGAGFVLGICTKSVAAPHFSDEVYSVSHKPGVLGAVRLAVDIPMLMGCDALGPGRTLAQWRHGKTEKH